MSLALPQQGIDLRLPEWQIRAAKAEEHRQLALNHARLANLYTESAAIAAQLSTLEQ